MKVKELLEKMGACKDAIAWIGEKTVKEAWETCERGDWMLWYYAKKYPENIRELILAKGYCAQTVIHLMKNQHSLDSVQAAIDFGNGLINEKELKAYAYAAVDAANAAAYAAYAYAAADAAYAAAYAANAAANAAAYAANAAAYAAANANAADARQKMKLENIELLRSLIRGE